MGLGYDWSTVDPADPYAMPELDLTSFKIERYLSFTVRDPLALPALMGLVELPVSWEPIPLTAMTWPG